MFVLLPCVPRLDFTVVDNAQFDRGRLCQASSSAFAIFMSDITPAVVQRSSFPVALPLGRNANLLNP